MYDLTINKNAATHRLLKYDKHQQMTKYLKEVQLKENRDIIVIAHQEEMYEIGNMLVNPDVTNRCFFFNFWVISIFCHH